ncbi:hypothetical protein OG884_05685 [Streptosporangium sp. NBC_01755]|uniref:hypothetical protein n=1 Tax=Streptosporangium sp. NBC_01755 TaxID=2975949 RepID=UPI002DD84483|nr:hypothetical protein [Streptosporangium sp. NBC_01755]WSD01416.1 hypothetical protein OG884_05685 [Streptosporangium sp. NBC_01755]
MSEQDPRLSELRRTMLDAGLDLVWEIRLPSPLDDPSDCRHGCNGDCLVSGSEVCSFVCHGPVV